MFTSPGQLFIGSMYAAERPFLLAVLKRAREEGYTRFVEPCSGTLMGCRIAKLAGFGAAEASDVSLVPAIIGADVAGAPIGSLGVTYRGVPAESAESALFDVYQTLYAAQGWNENGQYQLRELMARREELTARLRGQLDELRRQVPGSFAFEPLDLFEHLERVKDDPEAVVSLWPPTYKSGYEKYYRHLGEVFCWHEPEYTVWEPESGYRRVAEEYADARCLILMGEETAEHVGDAVYGRAAQRFGLNTYFVSNKPDLVRELTGYGVSRPSQPPERGGRYSLLDRDVTGESRLSVAKLPTDQMRHYKKLLCKLPTAATSNSGYALFVDGMLAGVFGYEDMGTAMANSDRASIGFAYAVPGHRLDSLLHLVASQREQLTAHYDDVVMQRVRCVKTLIATDKPAASKMRGIAKLVDRTREKRLGDVLVYEMPIGELTLDECRDEFIRMQQPKPARRRRGHGRAGGRHGAGEGAAGPAARAGRERPDDG